MKCTQLTATSWLLDYGSTSPGLLFAIGERFLYLSITKRLEFESFDEVIEKFGGVESEVQERAVTHIGKFPIKHRDAIIISDNPPLYNRGGNIIFAAGFWGLHYPNGWSLTFCPKKDTLDSYESIGPFCDRLEAQIVLNSKNHQLKG